MLRTKVLFCYNLYQFGTNLVWFFSSYLNKLCILTNLHGTNSYKIHVMSLFGVAIYNNT